jgi:hypothetical protein
VLGNSIVLPGSVFIRFFTILGDLICQKIDRPVGSAQIYA